MTDRPHTIYSPADKPTMYFIGVTTGKSSIMKVFPAWAEHLGLGDVQIRGMDFKQHDDSARYREAVSFIKADPLSLGALVTTHKLDVVKACRDIFDHFGPYAEQLGEASSISKREDGLWGHAKDPVTAGLSLEAIIDDDYWQRTGGELLLLGAGGSSLATTMYLMEKKDRHRWPLRIVVTNRSEPRLEEMKEIHARINPGIPVEYHLCPTPEMNDAVMAGMPPASVIVNATGLGKDAPGSPITSAGTWPQHSIAWEFNYRGDLVFIDQAKAQPAEKSIRIEDGWVYFIHGWTRVIAEVFHIDIPTAGPEFDKLADIAANVTGRC
jgi:shikimate 5-dehydrogenase